MKKLVFVLGAVGALLAIPAIVMASSVTEGESELESFGGSGIEAEFEFVDDGTKLTITGEAEGLTPGVTYVSLIYDTGSTATGPEACEPSGPALIEKMLIGFWTVDADGDGTLSATNLKNEENPPTFLPDNIYVPLSQIGTVSIRILQPPFFPLHVSVTGLSSGSSPSPGLPARTRV